MPFREWGLVPDKRRCVDNATLVLRWEHGIVDHQMKNEAGGSERKHGRDQRGTREQLIQER